MNQNTLTLEIETPGAPEGAEDLMRAVARAALGLEGLWGVGVAARLVDDEAIREITAPSAASTGPRTCSAFPPFPTRRARPPGAASARVRREYDPSAGVCFLGDLVISLPRAQAQAREYGHSLERELGYLTATGWASDGLRPCGRGRRAGHARAGGTGAFDAGARAERRTPFLREGRS